MKVEVAVLGSPSVPNSPYGFFERKATLNKAQELCESRGGRPGLPVPNSPYGFCGRKATLNKVQELCESRGGRPGLPVPNSPYGFFERKATLNKAQSCVKVEVDDLGSPSVPNSPYGFFERKATLNKAQSCVKVEVPSLIVLNMVSVCHTFVFLFQLYVNELTAYKQKVC